MAQLLFTVSALWDDEAQRYYSQSDIVGVHIEAADLDGFEDLLMDVASGVMVANHDVAGIIKDAGSEMKF